VERLVEVYLISSARLQSQQSQAEKVLVADVRI
jgi:hypothetical protein